jgi:hypothetical protein
MRSTLLLAALTGASAAAGSEQTTVTALFPGPIKLSQVDLDAQVVDADATATTLQLGCLAFAAGKCLAPTPTVVNQDVSTWIVDASLTVAEESRSVGATCVEDTAKRTVDCGVAISTVGGPAVSKFTINTPVAAAQVPITVTAGAAQLSASSTGPGTPIVASNNPAAGTSNAVPTGSSQTQDSKGDDQGVASNVRPGVLGVIAGAFAVAFL